MTWKKIVNAWENVIINALVMREWEGGHKVTKENNIQSHFSGCVCGSHKLFNQFKEDVTIAFNKIYK